MEVLPETKLFKCGVLSYDVKIMCMFENINVFLQVTFMYNLNIVFFKASFTIIAPPMVRSP